MKLHNACMRLLIIALIRRDRGQLYLTKVIMSHIRVASSQSEHGRKVKDAGPDNIPI